MEQYGQGRRCARIRHGPARANLPRRDRPRSCRQPTASRRPKPAGRRTSHGLDGPLGLRRRAPRSAGLGLYRRRASELARSTVDVTDQVSGVAVRDVRVVTRAAHTSSRRSCRSSPARGRQLQRRVGRLLAGPRCCFLVETWLPFRGAPLLPSAVGPLRRVAGLSAIAHESGTSAGSVHPHVAAPRGRSAA